MQDYRSEVKELFAADEQLAAEVEYNLKTFEQQKEQEQELEQRLGSFMLSPRAKVSQLHTQNVHTVSFTHMDRLTHLCYYGMYQGSAAASPAPGVRATPRPPQAAQRPSNTPKSADALR